MLDDIIKDIDDAVGVTRDGVKTRKRLSGSQKLSKATVRKQRYRANLFYAGKKQKTLDVPVDYVLKFKQAVAMIELKDASKIKPPKVKAPGDYQRINIEYSIINEPAILTVYKHILSLVKV